MGKLKGGQFGGNLGCGEVQGMAHLVWALLSLHGLFSFQDAHAACRLFL